MATAPQDLGTGNTLRLAGTLAAGIWVDYRLSLLDPSLEHCSLWLDPELFYKDDRLYLATVCVAYEDAERQPGKSTYSLFEVPVFSGGFGEPLFLGSFTDADDAFLLGGDELSKGNLVQSRSVNSDRKNTVSYGVSTPPDTTRDPKRCRSR